MTDAEIPTILDRMTCTQCLELLEHVQSEFRRPKNRGVALRMYYGITPCAGRRPLFLLLRERGKCRYKLSAAGNRVKIALMARA